MTIPELHLILLGLTVAAGLAAALHILLTMRDDTQRAALWLLLVVTFPVFPGVIRSGKKLPVLLLLSFYRGIKQNTLP